MASEPELFTSAVGWQAAIAGAIVAAGLGLKALLKARQELREDGAETVGHASYQLVITSLKTHIDSLTEQNTRQATEIERLQVQNLQLRSELGNLRTRLERLEQKYELPNQ